MTLPIFTLEDYLGEREFKARYMLCGSDTESFAMAELIAMASPETRFQWETLRLHYTEPQGLPVLREKLASLYAPLTKDHFLTFAGAEEGIYCAMHALLTSEDHAVVITPCYQSLKSIPESLCEVTRVPLLEAEGWQLDLGKVMEALKPNTKVILINFPHNPTGSILSKEGQTGLITLCRAKGIYLFSDEVYRGLEHNAADRLPPIATVYEMGMSLGVMSKAYGLAGLRVGWVACQDAALLKAMLQFKFYLSICNSAPSELLALMALENEDPLLTRNRNIVQANLAELTQFMDRWKALLTWQPPKAGCIAFPRLTTFSVPVAETLLIKTGVLLLPGHVYNEVGQGFDNHFRIGFGRKNFSEGLSALDRFMEQGI